MAELEAVIVTRLTGYAGLSALIGARVHPAVMPERSPLPVITYQRIDGTRESGMTAEHGMAHPRITIKAWGKTYASAKAVATQVRGALQRWSDATTDPVILDCFLDNEADDYEPDTNLYSVMQDWIIWYRE